MWGKIIKMYTPIPEQDFDSRTDVDYKFADLAYLDPRSDEIPHLPFSGISPLDRLSSRMLKRGFDICVSLVALPLILLVGVVVASLIVITSPGPILFSQRRILRGGDRFSIWKFRTMCLDAAQLLEDHLTQYPEDREEWQTTQKLKRDPRIISIGVFLRRTSLDELPQIWNVLKGEMSIVGPRPIVEAEIERYADDFIYYAAVKPGITGLWQTSGRSRLSYPERVALDRFYVENWTMWLEMKILFRTIRTVVLSDGAY
jgi:Undecaprenyl-phosphate galactose phosphotransferase WbaP